MGRISADKPEQVQNAVRKIIDYESGKYAGAWQSKVLTIAASYQWAREDAQVVVNNFVRPNYQAVMMETILTKMEEKNLVQCDTLKNRLGVEPDPFELMRSGMLFSDPSSMAGFLTDL